MVTAQGENIHSKKRLEIGEEKQDDVDRTGAS